MVVVEEEEEQLRVKRVREVVEAVREVRVQLAVRLQLLQVETQVTQQRLRQ
jgi:hypothetical protein